MGGQGCGDNIDFPVSIIRLSEYTSCVTHGEALPAIRVVLPHTVAKTYYSRTTPRHYCSKIICDENL